MGTSINQLSAIDTVQAGDQVPVYSTSNGDARKVSMSKLKEFINADELAALAEKVPYTELADFSGAGLVGSIQSGTGSVVRTVQSKLRDTVSVKDQGATGDGATDDRAALNTANTNLSELVFTKGTYRVSSNLTLSKPVTFLPGAQLSIDAAVTVTFNTTIESGRQQIFTGNGSVLLNAEESHYAHPEWFGVFPDQSAVDAAIGLQKLSNSVVAGRECLIDVAPGTYYLSGPVSWSRACRIRGAGERLAHFRCNAAFASGNVFTTAEQGVAFEGIQFSSATSPRTSGNYIKLSFNYCRAQKIWFTDGFGGIEVAANVCDVRDVTSFLFSSAAGSYIVKLSDGFNGTRVDNINYVDTAGTSMPEYLVRVDAHQYFNIGRLNGRGVGTVLGIIPSSGTCKIGQADSVIAQSPTINGVVIQSTGTATLEGIQIGKISGDTLSGYGCKLQKDGAGIFKYVEIEALQAKACTLGGFKVDATVGSLDHWHLKGGFSRQGAANGYDIANSDYWTMMGCESVSNTGTGTLIALGCANFIYTNNKNLFNTAAALTDNSGAVTKAVANNI